MLYFGFFGTMLIGLMTLAVGLFCYWYFLIPQKGTPRERDRKYMNGKRPTFQLMLLYLFIIVIFGGFIGFGCYLIVPRVLDTYPLLSKHYAVTDSIANKCSVVTTEGKVYYLHFKEGFNISSSRDICFYEGETFHIEYLPHTKEVVHYTPSLK